MDSRLKRVLIRKRTYLLDNIYDASDICDHLISKELMSLDIKDEIMSKPTRKARKLELLDHLPTLGPAAFGELLESLNNANSKFISTELTNELQQLLNIESGVTEERKSSSDSEDETSRKGVSSVSEKDQTDSVMWDANTPCASQSFAVPRSPPPEESGLDRPQRNNLSVDYPERFCQPTVLNLTEDSEIQQSPTDNTTPPNFSLGSGASSHLKEFPSLLSNRDNISGMSAPCNRENVSSMSTPPTTTPVSGPKSQVDLVNLMLRESLPSPTGLNLTANDRPINNPPSADKHAWVGDLPNTSRLITDQELALIARDMSASLYFVVGSMMGFKKGKLEQYQANFPHSVAMQMSKMSMDWKASAGKTATISAFLEIMKAANVDEEEYKEVIQEYSRKAEEPGSLGSRGSLDRMLQPKSNVLNEQFV